jgi:hypothetical protein
MGRRWPWLRAAQAAFIIAGPVAFAYPPVPYESLGILFPALIIGWVLVIAKIGCELFEYVFADMLKRERERAEWRRKHPVREVQSPWFRTWFMFQLVVACAFMFWLAWASDGRLEAGHGLILGFGAAWLVSAILSYSFLIARRLLRRDNAPPNQPANQNPSLIRPLRHERYSSKHIVGPRVGDQPRNLPDSLPKPPAL